MERLQCWFVIISESNNATSLVPMTTFICSTLGIVLSILAVMLLILTAILFTEWRHSYKNQLLIQFMLARFMYTMSRYFFDVVRFLDVYHDYFNPFYLGTIPLVYTELVLVSWMYIFSKQMYDCLARVFNVGTPNIIKVSLFAWLIPAAVSFLFFVIHYVQYENEVQIYILYLFLLKWPALSANGILLASVLRSILNTNKSKTERNPRIILVMIVLIFTFCFQQAVTDFHKLMFIIFKFDRNVACTPVFFIFANIVTVYHCAFSIMFWLFGNKQTRTLWSFTSERKKHSGTITPVTCSTIL